MKLKHLAWFVYGFVFIAFLFMVLASLSGWRFDVIPTGSMAPSFNPGGMVVTRPTPIEEVQVGDGVLFKEMRVEGDAHICHRVIDVREDGDNIFLQTQGDANEHPDLELVSKHNFVGKTVLYVPHVGAIAYSTRLHLAPLTLMGRRVSVATLLIVAVGIIIVATESVYICEWMYAPHLMRQRERLKKRRRRLTTRRHGAPPRG